MNKVKVFKAIATFYVCAGIIMIQLIDSHPYMGLLLVGLSFFAAEQYNGLSIRAREQQLLDDLMEFGTGND